MRRIALLVVAICLVSCVFAWAAGDFYAYGKRPPYDQSVYTEDSVTVNDNQVFILVNMERLTVEYFFSPETNKWVEASRSKIDLQKEYVKKVQLLRMQSVLNRYREQSFGQHFQEQRSR